MINLEAIRARDAAWRSSVDLPSEKPSQMYRDRRALVKAYDELVAERALLVTRAENAEAALVEAQQLNRDWFAANAQGGWIDDNRKRLAAANALLREARTEVEWWIPDECNATDQETSKLRYWYKVRDRIDAHLAEDA